MVESTEPVLPTAAPEPPAEFVRLVRDALVHLYDPAHLLRHPLQQLLSPSLPRYGDPVQNLRDLILDAIEALEPPTRRRSGSIPESSAERDQRPYLVLTHRYVDGFTIEETVETLHISPRQFQREHQKGLLALAARLWDASRQPAVHQSGGEQEKLDLKAAIDTFGVQLEAATLAEVVASAWAPAEVLAASYGVRLRRPDPSDRAGLQRCLCDRALTKQALLTCLSSVLESRPAEVAVNFAGQPRSPGLEVRFARSPAASLQEGLQACEVLLLPQGAVLEPVPGRAGPGRPEDGIEAIRLIFRPEASAHVLVIDDNEEMLELYRRYLATGNTAAAAQGPARQRYAVSVAASAQEAEAILESSRPDVIILDVMMREVDGWELLQRLRSRPDLAGVPVLVCSILNEPQLARALGAQAYLKKPITPGDLLGALEELLV